MTTSTPDLTGSPRVAYIEVNECKIFATTWGADWWIAFRQRFAGTGRIATVTVTLAGDVCRVACDSRADADSLAAHMIDQGLPQTAVVAREEHAS